MTTHITHITYKTIFYDRPKESFLAIALQPQEALRAFGAATGPLWTFATGKKLLLLLLRLLLLLLLLLLLVLQ